MPTLTLAMSNGHNPVSGISFRRVKQDDANGHAGRPYSSDGRIGKRQANGINGAERSASDCVKKNEEHSAVIRRKMRRGKVGEKRKGRIYDKSSELSFFNNNGPLKAFPLNNNIKHNGSLTHEANDSNKNNSSLSSSALDTSTSPSSSCSSSVADNAKTVPVRSPLQRVGHSQHKQNISSRILDPQLPGSHHSQIPEAFPMLPTSSGPSSSSGSPKMEIKPSSLKSVLHRNGSSQNGHPRQTTSKDVVTFAESNLPPGMLELVRDCFIPGENGCFKHTVNLPLLKSTDASILKRRSSLSLKRRNRINTTPNNGQSVKPKTSRYAALQLDESNSLVRSRSTASEMFLQPDILILKSCFSIILSFMGDDKGLLQKNHSRRSIGRIVSSKRKYISHPKRLWRKSSTGSRMSSPKTSPTSSLKQNATERPFSMFIHSPPEVPAEVDRKKKVSSKPQPSVTNSENLSNTVSSLTVLEKIHFLVNVGLKLEYLRDEIYCLLMKQLVSNPSPYSSALGWILFSLIVCSFPPSEKIVTYVENFIDHHRHLWSSYCGKQLNRTLLNGPRTNPPCSLEIEAIKSRVPILLPVICADDSVRTINIDSATTSKEMLASMSEKNRIGDFLGFCLVMQAGGKIVNLGAGRFPVLDAISQVELHAKDKFHKTPCRFYYRRDIFSPRDLFSASDEHMASWLTFSQICGGVRTGEYFCKKATDLCLLISHQYCVRHGIENVDEKKVAMFCEHRLPSDVYKADKKNWCKMVTNTLRALSKEKDRMLNPIDVMAQAIRYAMQNFTKHFVRAYRITTFLMVGSGCIHTSELTMTLSHVGVTVKQGDSSKTTVGDYEITKVPVVLMDAPANDLKNVKLDTNRSIFGSTLTITVHGRKSYEIESAHGPEIYAVLSRYIRDILTGANKESKA